MRSIFKKKKKNVWSTLHSMLSQSNKNPVWKLKLGHLHFLFVYCEFSQTGCVPAVSCWLEGGWHYICSVCHHCRNSLEPCFKPCGALQWWQQCVLNFLKVLVVFLTITVWYTTRVTHTISFSIFNHRRIAYILFHSITSIRLFIYCFR